MSGLRFPGSPPSRDRQAEMKEQLMARNIFETHHLLMNLPLILDVRRIIDNLMMNLFAGEIDHGLQVKLLANIEETLAKVDGRINVYGLCKNRSGFHQNQKYNPCKNRLGVYETCFNSSMLLKDQYGALKLCELGNLYDRDIEDSILREIAENYNHAIACTGIFGWTIWL